MLFEQVHLHDSIQPDMSKWQLKLKNTFPYITNQNCFRAILYIYVIEYQGMTTLSYAVHRAKLGCVKCGSMIKSCTCNNEVQYNGMACCTTILMTKYALNSQKTPHSLPMQVFLTNTLQKNYNVVMRFNHRSGSAKLLLFPDLDTLSWLSSDYLTD